jgi:OOP family OmpA-OmpF porin
MRPLILAPMLCFGLIAASVSAQQPTAQYSVEDIQKSFAGDEQPDATSSDPETVQGSGGKARVGKTRGFSIKPAEFGTPQDVKTATRKGTGTAGAPGAPTKSYAMAPVVKKKDLLISFENASTELTAQATANIRVFAQALKTPTLASTRFAIDGHTNQVGDRDYNVKLSQGRAEAVAELLEELGVDKSRLEVNGFGYDKLADAAHPTAPTNRRVEARRLN